MAVSFQLTAETKITCNLLDSKPLKNILKIFQRDLAKKLLPEPTAAASMIAVDVNQKYSNFLAEEQFRISFPTEQQLLIQSRDELGAIYGLLYLSKEFLGIQPFWFWHDQVIQPVSSISIPLLPYQSPIPRIRFRGWFINDEVLLSEWQVDGSNQIVWEMVFESLLRCQGNMVIPGTDLNSKKQRRLARDMGLWITHHHAEPLGAEMFLRAYPTQKASYVENQELFEDLWRTAVLEQQDLQVVWNVGFRGQGDKAFWHHDSRFVTAKSRGKLISQVIQRQCEIVREYLANPVFCTNLYGEILELYASGHLEIPEDVIKIWGDSGYGKMVSRRQGNHNPRLPALAPQDDPGLNGIYYHASFYDLQASGVLTMIPNSPDFIKSELETCLERKMDQYWIINCGNVKPHSYILDLIKDFWLTGEVDVLAHRQEFLEAYYNNSYLDELSQLFGQYFTATIQYGEHDDERAAEQFYHHPARELITAWLKGRTQEHLEQLYWATGKLDFPDQIQWFKDKCLSVVGQWESLLQRCIDLKARLPENDAQVFEDMFVVQVKLHYFGCRGLISLCKSYQYFAKHDYLNAFMEANTAMEYYRRGWQAMQATEHDHWQGYYSNDCLTNVKLTVYCCDSLRRYLRVIGDGPSFTRWEREYLYNLEDKNIVLLTNTKNQLTDDQLYAKLKKACPRS